MRLSEADALALVRSLLHYDPATGVLTWRQERRMGRTGRGHLIAETGDRAGGLEAETGYWQINISGVGKMRLHRLIWWMVTGKKPVGLIDHRNGVRDDNRWDNLRDASATVNSENRHQVRRDSKTGLMGVQYHKAKGRFTARITKHGKTTVLGYFREAEEASNVYQAAKREMHAVGNV